MLRRLAVWATAVGTCVVGTLWVALMTASGSGNHFEHFCGEPGRLPADVNGYQGPQWDGPVTFRCTYPGHRDLLATDWTPLLGLVAVSTLTLGGVVAALWFASRALKPDNRQKAGSFTRL